jgi:hypothetical protein
MNEANFVLIKIIHISTYAQKSECQHLIRWTLVTTLLSILQHGTAHDGHVVGNEIVHTYLEPFRYPSSSLASCKLCEWLLRRLHGTMNDDGSLTNE